MDGFDPVAATGATPIRTNPESRTMSVIGDFTVPSEAFALDHALSAHPEVTVEADRLASHSSMEVLPFMWVTGGNAEELKTLLEDDPTVEKVTIADDMEEETLFRFEWTSEFKEFINDVVDHHAVISRAEAADGEWSLRLRFAEESMVSEFQTYFHEQGRAFEVQSLSSPTTPRENEFGMTAAQREALAVAARAGYFEIPREISATEVGELLGISGNAASERIRRGCGAMIDAGLLLNREENRE